MLGAALLVEIDAVHGKAHGIERGVGGGGTDVPALQLLPVYLVGGLAVSGKGVPVKLAAELLLHKINGLINLMDAQLLGGGVIIHHG